VGPWVIAVCLLAPAITFTLSLYSQQLFAGYVMGVENLIVNGCITFFGLWIISKFARYEALVD
jgi:hypothetical protein